MYHLPTPWALVTLSQLAPWVLALLAKTVGSFRKAHPKSESVSIESSFDLLSRLEFETKNWIFLNGVLYSRNPRKMLCRKLSKKDLFFLTFSLLKSKFDDLHN
jgi:hypothetical protein